MHVCDVLIQHVIEEFGSKGMIVSPPIAPNYPCLQSLSPLCLPKFTFPFLCTPFHSLLLNCKKHVLLHILVLFFVPLTLRD